MNCYNITTDKLQSKIKVKYYRLSYNNCNKLQINLSSLLDSQLQNSTSLANSPDAETSSLVLFTPGVGMPPELPTLEVTHGVSLLPSTVLPDPIIYQNINQNDVTSIQNFTNHTQCIE